MKAGGAALVNAMQHVASGARRDPERSRSTFPEFKVQTADAVPGVWHESRNKAGQSERARTASGRCLIGAGPSKRVWADNRETRPPPDNNNNNSTINHTPHTARRRVSPPHGCPRALIVGLPRGRQGCRPRSHSAPSKAQFQTAGPDCGVARGRRSRFGPRESRCLGCILIPAELDIVIGVIGINLSTSSFVGVEPSEFGRGTSRQSNHSIWPTKEALLISTHDPRPTPRRRHTLLG
ncbi:uncharacterized protein K452DRAFT_35037 [Aplosporella prunicola CBS 121167]|uniref:Uncharacterized protein n=1 Tax=Aplosporella prunicola CBS 121167 TaxID=1176127 RepID=A0A6A6BEZ6_9PEZI|nr:uncharacterized protein K452DRAFT_35037 [Aplosporella prunicola CBS 121167]KAF2141885.1 hypothetical protein K452DRAFT_35037 [Aplosporella prunicola CBS 121167]